MDASLGQQWLAVDFGPHTTAATALQVRTACSKIANAPPIALPAHYKPVDVVYDVRYNTTNASPANIAELQTCLQHYKAVTGVEPADTGDEGG